MFTSVSPTVWILTAGRGFPLGEHETIGFAAGELHEELVHLPLMLRWPNVEHAGERTSALTQPMDLAAFDMCREARLPILVFNYTQDGAIERAVAGHPVGTIISG